MAVINTIYSLLSLLAPMTELCAVYYFIQIVFSAVLLDDVRPMDKKFTCASKDIYKHCVEPYKRLYFLNLFVPLGIMVPASIAIMAKEKRVKESNNCKLHIHFLHFMRGVASFSIHCGLGLGLWGIYAFEIPMHCALTDVNGNSTFSCVDKLAEYNIALCANIVLSIVITLVEVLYFIYRWNSTKNKRIKFEIEPNKCKDCNYFIKKFKRVQGIILIQ